MKFKIYISGPLKNVPDLEAAKQFYEYIANIIIEAGHEAYLPHHHTDPIKHAHLSSQEVFYKDYDAIMSCDMILAVLQQDSLGVGAELGIVYEKAMPIIVIHEKDANLSRFVMGMIGSNKCASRIIEYETDIELKQKLFNLLHKIDLVLKGQLFISMQKFDI